MGFRISQFRIGIRIQLITAAAVAGMVAIMAVALAGSSRQMNADRAAKTQHVIETAYGTMAYFGAEQLAGRLPREAAQASAIAAIKAMRYGNGDYFWINDLDARVVMHPIKPELDGTDGARVLNNGFSPFTAAADIGRKSGGGFFNYLFDGPLQVMPGTLVELRIDTLDRPLRGRFVDRNVDGNQIQLLLNHDHLNFMETVLSRLAAA